VAFLVDEQVLRFKVSVNNIFIVHVANGKQDLTNVEHSNVVTEPSIFPKAVKKLSSRTELEDHINEGVILEGGFEGVDERVIELAENLFL
jgi:tRNA G37 N-methylase TrmD